MNDTYHFIGLGGIGMSALARVWMQRGGQVQGSDAKPSALLEQLRQEGAKVHIGHDQAVVQSVASVIYSTDIKTENVELLRATELNIPRFHRSDFLDFLMRDKLPLLVTGTHGKTTTTSLLISALFEGGLDPSFVVGGIHQKLKTNGRAGAGSFFIAEADESDGSFLKTIPYGAIVTNLEDEHLSYWKNGAALDQAFAQFCGRVEQYLFWCGDDPRLRALAPVGISYGFESTNQLRITAFSFSEKGIRFDLEYSGISYADIELSLHGRHNALNGAAVFGLCLALNVPESAIRRAFSEFSGVARRLELKGSAHALEVYDDYGHHPTEIKATLSALRGKISERRMVVIFQPHRYSRVRDLFTEFTTCFDEADLVVMTDIHSAGEAPIEGASSADLYQAIERKIGKKVRFIERTGLEEKVATILRPHDVVLTIGAGDITHAGDPILRHYQTNHPKWTVALLFGGTSSEHEVSLMSARRFRDALDPSLYQVKCFGITKQGEWIEGADALEKLEHKKTLSNTTLPIESLLACDVALPVFHGPQGEDGMFQGFLDTLNIPYAGCDYRAGALCMNKAWTKHVALQKSIATAPFVEIDAQEFRHNRSALLGKINANLSYPVWVKPVHLGSSVGVRRAANEIEALEAADFAFYYDDAIIVEAEMSGIQVEYAILGNETLRVAPSCEILNSGFHDFKSKYGPTACGMAIPARISQPHQKLGEQLALQIYRATGCKGLARVDFFFDQENRFWLNEINPFPGFTATSAYPSMWEQTGMTLTQLANHMLILAFQRHRRLLEVRGK